MCEKFGWTIEYVTDLTYTQLILLLKDYSNKKEETKEQTDSPTAEFNKRALEKSREQRRRIVEEKYTKKQLTLEDILFANGPVPPKEK